MKDIPEFKVHSWERVTNLLTLEVLLTVSTPDGKAVTLRMHREIARRIGLDLCGRGPVDPSRR